jgi:hypothetical protein
VFCIGHGTSRSPLDVDFTGHECPRFPDGTPTIQPPARPSVLPHRATTQRPFVRGHLSTAREN